MIAVERLLGPPEEISREGGGEDEKSEGRCNGSEGRRTGSEEGLCGDVESTRDFVLPTKEGNFRNQDKGGRDIASLYQNDVVGGSRAPVMR